MSQMRIRYVLPGWSRYYVFSQFLTDWLVIATCFLIWNEAHSKLMLPILIYVVGGRQHGVAILMHETIHQKILDSHKISNLIGYLCAWPLFVSWQSYRANHLAHHKFANTANDPDLTFKLRAARVDWTFPKAPTSLCLLFFKDCVGNGVVTNIRRILRYRGQSTESMRRDPSLPRAGVTLAFIACLVGTVGVSGFILLWVIPFLTVLPFLLRIRSVSEHFGIGERYRESTRNVAAGWVERELLAFAPHQIGWHLTHHLDPAIPSCRLAQADNDLKSRSPTYRELCHRTGYIFGIKTVLSDLRL
jgi:fatty acid desaturase